MAKRTGLLIVFEGIDGTGKSTQLEKIGRYLCGQGYDIIVTREPTNGPYGRQIRALYRNRGSVTRQEELELFLADRREHVEQLIEPALNSGRIVLCDRYYLSTVAYQGAAGGDPDYILERNRFAPEPDLVLLFDMPVRESMARITSSRRDVLNDFEQFEALQDVASRFRQMQQPYITTIDASGSVEAVHRLVRDQVMNLVARTDLKQTLQEMQ